MGRPAKDQDFVVPGVGYEELRDALAPHGRVEDLEVAGRRVGLRLYPSDRSLRSLAPAGIEFAPPRTERSTGPGRHDFEIVASPEISLEQDMARRDFTINAIAKRLETGELLDPFKGREDLEARVLRTVSPESFREDPLRLVRGLRFVSEHDLDPDEQTLAQMRENASSVRLVSAERIGGGFSADGMGELSKLLLGEHPAKALRLAAETGVFAELLPELEPDDFAVVQASADAGDPLAVRLGALLRGLDGPRRRERCCGVCVIRRSSSGASPQRVEGRPDTVSDDGAARRPACPRALRRGDCARCCAPAARSPVDDSTAAWLHAARAGERRASSHSQISRSTGAISTSSGLPRDPRIGEVARDAARARRRRPRR